MNNSGNTLIQKEAFIKLAVEILVPYQERLLHVFSSSIELLGEDSEMRKACSYAMNCGGKRLRPAIVWMVAEALHSQTNVDLAALSIEFFHISSLVTDDLPCMDNDDFRRGVPTTHKEFSEPTALLASFALTAAAFEAIALLKLPQDKSYEILQMLVSRASRAIGGPGLIGGQYLDLNPPVITKQVLEVIFDRKTCVLFDLAFLFGWILGGGDFKKIQEVSTLATYFGRAFQILDDIEDMEQDKIAGKRINFALCFGVAAAKEEAKMYIDNFLSLAKNLGLGSSPLLTLIEAMRP